jgi:hypothetical protein
MSSAFVFIISNENTLFNFEKEWCTFNKEKGCLKKKNQVVTIAVNVQKDS